MNQRMLKSEDTISGRMGRAYATIDGNVEEMMYIKKLEAKMEKKKTEIPILGKPSTESKATGVSYTGTATIYYVTSAYRRLLHKYAKEGIDTYFDILVENQDPTSATGKQAILLKGVNLDDGLIALIDIDNEDALEEEISFTFSDWDILKDFDQL